MTECLLTPQLPQMRRTTLVAGLYTHQPLHQLNRLLKIDFSGSRDSRLLWFVPSKTTSPFTSTFSIIIKDSQIVQISTLWVASLKSALKFDFLFNHLIKFRACIYINKQLDIASANRFFLFLIL